MQRMHHGGPVAVTYLKLPCVAFFARKYKFISNLLYAGGWKVATVAFDAENHPTQYRR